MQRPDRQAILMALLAAALFGAVVPVSKVLLTGIGPVTLAGLLYLGAGGGTLIVRHCTRRRYSDTEAPIRRSDLPWLSGIIIFGSIMAPILLMIGLSITPASTTSLLLNGELACTAIIAGIAFREHMGWRAGGAILAVIAGGVILTLDPSESFQPSPGAILVILACFCWGLDNNLTRVISDKEPAMIVIIKGGVAGIFGIILGSAIGEPLPHMILIPIALITGGIGYGLSIICFIRALRVLGAARTGALFASAPFIGLIIAGLALGEPLGREILFSLPFMAAGTWLIATETHGHLHSHSSLLHDHRHQHDDDHHDHTSGDNSHGDDHAHPHFHIPIAHAHPHSQDLHHGHHHKDEEEGENRSRKEIS